MTAFTSTEGVPVKEFEVYLSKCYEIFSAKSDVLGDLQALVQVTFADQFGNKAPTLWIDARSTPAIMTHTTPEGKPDVFVNTNPRLIVRVNSGSCLPMAAVFNNGSTGQHAPQGDLTKAIQFMDHLSPEPSQILPPISALHAQDLPVPTEDLGNLRLDIEKWGYGILENALSPEETKMLKTLVLQQAAGERKAGVASFDGGPKSACQRVWTLFNKGQEFLDLLNHQIVRDLAPWFLGDHPLLWACGANIVNPGSKAQSLHVDQAPMLQTRALGLALSVDWNLVGTTLDNGATRLIPGSHLGYTAPANPLSLVSGTMMVAEMKVCHNSFDLTSSCGKDNTITVPAPAGSALVMESRLWHATGPYSGKGDARVVIFAMLTRNTIRPKENATLLIKRDIEATLTDELRSLFGLRTAVGGVGGLPDETKDGVLNQISDFEKVPGNLRVMTD